MTMMDDKKRGTNYFSEFEKKLIEKMVHVKLIIFY